MYCCFYLRYIIDEVMEQMIGNILLTFNNLLTPPKKFKSALRRNLKPFPGFFANGARKQKINDTIVIQSL